MDNALPPVQKTAPAKKEAGGFAVKAPMLDKIRDGERISTSLGIIKAIKEGIYYHDGAKIFLIPFPDDREINVTRPRIVGSSVGKKAPLDSTRGAGKQDYLMLTLEHAQAGAFSARVQIELPMEDAAKLMKEFGVAKAGDLEGRQVFGYSLGYLTLGISAELPQQ